MRLRKLLFTIMMLFLVTGCSVENISNKDINKNVDIILNNKIKYSNQDAIGYQYYLPNGINVKEVMDFNQVLYSNGNTYYLYADVVSYYHKVSKEYKKDSKAYISKKLDYGKKTGYLEVNKDGNKYFVEMMFNYAKIEAYVSKKDLNETISNMSYILSSVKYNKNIIETLLGSQKYDLSENEEYNIFDSKKTNSEDKFLDYVNEYDNYNGEIENLIEHEEVEANKDE